VTPREAMRATGHGPVWVVRQTGIERTRLDRLLNGRREWTPGLRRQFALAIGLAETSICFPTAPGESPAARDADAKASMPSEPIGEAVA